MEEIDDLYKQEVESIDEEFLESLKKGETHTAALKNYREKLTASMKRFEKNYERSLKIERAKLKNRKKIPAKTQKFNTLHVQHFDFEFTFWERKKIQISLFFFKIHRFFKKYFTKLVPSLLFYYYYKIKNAFRHFFIEITRLFNSVFTWTKKFIMGLRRRLHFTIL